MSVIAFGKGRTVSLIRVYGAPKDPLANLALEEPGQLVITVNRLGVRAMGLQSKSAVLSSTAEDVWRQLAARSHSGRLIGTVRSETQWRQDTMRAKRD